MKTFCKTYLLLKEANFDSTVVFQALLSVDPFPDLELAVSELGMVKLPLVVAHGQHAGDDQAQQGQADAETHLKQKQMYWDTRLDLNTTEKAF